MTGFGHPDWARTHPAATSTAPTVSALLREGATSVGKTIMDEMAYRLEILFNFDSHPGDLNFVGHNSMPLVCNFYDLISLMDYVLYSDNFEDSEVTLLFQDQLNQ